MHKTLIFSRHPTHKVGSELPPAPVKTLVRLGSYKSRTPKGVKITINEPEACIKAANKLKMKQAFEEHKVKTAKWWPDLLAFEEHIRTSSKSPFPIVAKNIWGSRGTGVYLLKNKKEYDAWKNHSNRRGQLYIIEKFRNFGREYRLHVTEEGCFYTCRKALKHNAPDELKWKFNHEQTVWLREENPNFLKPRNWKKIEAECVKALKAVGLHVGACDVKVAMNGKFFILEINSAPSFGDLTKEKYLEMIPKLIEKEHAKLQEKMASTTK